MISFTRSIAVLSLILGLFLGAAVSSAPLVKAEINTDEDLSVDVSNCSFEYYGYLFDVHYQGSRLNYFTDMWELSYCQVFDMLALYDDLERLREDYKYRARQCQDTSAEQAEYKKMMMEAYFIRNVWPYKQGVVKLHQVKETQEQIDTRLEDFKEEMLEKFVEQEKYVSEGLLEAYFADWSEKYDERIRTSYIGCNEGPWSEVTDVVDNFMETMIEISVNFQSLDDMWREMRAEQKAMVSEIKDLSNLKAKAPLEFGDAQEEFKAWKEQFSQQEGNVDWLGNSIDYPGSIGDLSELEQFGDSYNAEIATLEDAVNALDQGKAKQSLHEQYLAREARYNQLYAQNGSLVAEDLAGIVKQMNRIVKDDTNYYLPQIKAGLSRVYNMQCK